MRLLHSIFMLLPIFSASPLFAAPAITVSASGVTLLGTTQSISITVTLIDPNNTGMLRDTETGKLITVLKASTVTPGSTATAGPIYGNDVIKDGFGNLNATYYLVQVFPVTNNIVASMPALQNFYAFTGSGTIDLATATPLAPSFTTATNGAVSIPGILSVTGTTSFMRSIGSVGATIVTAKGVTTTGNSSFASVNNVCKADTQTGADAGAKIAACISSLPATGGIVDARGLQGAQTVSSNPFSGVTKPITLMLGAATYSLTGTGQFVINGNNVFIEGKGAYGNIAAANAGFNNSAPSPATYIKCVSGSCASGDTIKFAALHTGSNNGLIGGGIKDVVIDGANSAARLLDIDTASQMHFSNLFLTGATTDSLKLECNVTGITGITSTHDISFDNIQIDAYSQNTSANGLNLTSATTACDNFGLIFKKVFVQYANGNGIDITSADNDQFFGVQALRSTVSASTGKGIFLHGSAGQVCEGMYFFDLITSGAGGFTQQGTCTGSHIVMDRGNSDPLPTISSGNAIIQDPFNGQIISNQLIAGTAPASGTTSGDVAASRSSTTGALFLGTDGTCFLFRSSANVVQFPGACNQIQILGSASNSGQIALAGKTSGSVTITVPAVAGSNTATYPAATGEVAVTPSSTTILQGTATLTYTAISAQSCQEQTISITNASTTNWGVLATPRATLGNANLTWTAWVSASGTVSVRVCNPSAGTITPSAVTWGATVIQ